MGRLRRSDRVQYLWSATKSDLPPAAPAAPPAYWPRAAKPSDCRHTYIHATFYPNGSALCYRNSQIRLSYVIVTYLDSRLAYPRPRPRPRLGSFKTKTKTKTQQFQDQDRDRDSRLTRPILEVHDWDELWQTKSHGKQKIQHTSSCTQ